MAFIPVVNTAEIVFNITVAGKPMKVILHAKNGGSITITNLTALATAVIDVILGSVGSLFSSVTSINSLTLNDLTTSTGLTLTAVNGTSGHLPFAYSGGGTPVPNNSAFVVTMRTTVRGRSFRGRSYWPGLTSTMLNGENDIADVNVANVVSFQAALVLAINSTSGWSAVVVSKRTAGAPRTAGVTTPISGVTAFDKVGTQRRRLD